MAIYKNIKQILESKKLEQKDFAQALKVSNKQAHNYLNGHSKIDIEKIPAIAALLKIPISTIFETEEYTELHEPEMPYGCRSCLKKQKDIDELRAKLDEVNAKYIALLEGNTNARNCG